ncbi:MAG: hypothetical protein LPJ92_01660 [Rhodobacterales bacterium]|nr:hypothetical protein [Rhodobacterales bacterium]MDX5389020.1 hypothetical protein [Rhodobacterales bacterium]MDX5488709.1 hypothetical protein [Rhodobacterales bacterium]
MIGQLTGAVLRALSMALLVAMPSMLISGVGIDGSQFVMLLALIAAGLVMIEYNSEYPSLVAFRHAPPYNRLRFGMIFIAVLILAMLFRGKSDPGTMTHIMTSISMILGNLSDFPYSPVRLAVLMLPADMPDAAVTALRMAAGVCYTLSIVMVLIFLTMVHVYGWPARNGAFNVWINLPMFDATSGGDVVSRLRGHARLNLILGFLLPFMLPALVVTVADYVNIAALAQPQTLIWTMCLWAFLPASLMMRGIAMGRIASMIENKRRRTYAAAEGLQVI